VFKWAASVVRRPRGVRAGLLPLLPLVLIALLASPLAFAQVRRATQGVKQVFPYDGRLTFTRLYYGGTGSGLASFGSRGFEAWSHDYPAADRNLTATIDFLTNARVRLDETNILDLDDPELFENPVLYVWEPGFWTIQDSEAQRLREYLLKGGFVIFDDFEGPDHWDNLVEQMRRAMPEHHFIRIDEQHPIFQSFFRVAKLDVPHPYSGVTPAYFGMFENNDPSGRMLALANHNNDIAEYWEGSVETLYVSDHTGDAFRLGVNYYLYALTH
jgi:hypothetical protein